MRVSSETFHRPARIPTLKLRIGPTNSAMSTGLASGPQTNHTSIHLAVTTQPPVNPRSNADPEHTQDNFATMTEHVKQKRQDGHQRKHNTMSRWVQTIELGSSRKKRKYKQQNQPVATLRRRIRQEMKVGREMRRNSTGMDPGQGPLHTVQSLLHHITSVPQTRACSRPEARDRDKRRKKCGRNRGKNKPVNQTANQRDAGERQWM